MPASVFPKPVEATVKDISDQIANNTFTVPRTNTGVTVEDGGYVRIGNMAFVQMRLTLTTTVTSLCYDLPIPKTGLTSSGSWVVNLSNDQGKRIAITNQGVMQGDSMTSGTYIITGAYICKD